MFLFTPYLNILQLLNAAGEVLLYAKVVGVEWFPKSFSGKAIHSVCFLGYKIEHERNTICF
jgi:hypothetical protein